MRIKKTQEVEDIERIDHLNHTKVGSRSGEIELTSLSRNMLRLLSEEILVQVLLLMGYKFYKAIIVY